jgi:hypothetical protein
MTRVSDINLVTRHLKFVDQNVIVWAACSAAAFR